MSEDPVDLSSLDPDLDPAAADRFVSAVLSRVDARGRPDAPDVLVGAWMLARPLLAAGLVMFALLLASAVRMRSPRAVPVRTVAEAVGIPPEFLTERGVDRGAR